MYMCICVYTCIHMHTHMCNKITFPQAMREEEMEMQRRRLEEAKRRAGDASAAAEASDTKGAVKNDKASMCI